MHAIIVTLQSNKPFPARQAFVQNQSGHLDEVGFTNFLLPFCRYVSRHCTLSSSDWLGRGFESSGTVGARE